LDLFNIQPKKPNWDLRRDLDKRLEKLKPKTQSAINTLIRESSNLIRSEELALNTSVRFTGQRLGAAKKGTAGTEASAGGEDMAEAIGRRTIDEEAGAMSDEDEV
jgi:coiled-coil domain-containing protein 12